MDKNYYKAKLKDALVKAAIANKNAKVIDDKIADAG